MAKSWTAAGRRNIWQLPSVHSAAFVYVILLLSAVLYRRFITDANDPYKCEALRSNGLWYNDRTWLTPGCTTERYGTHATQECLAGNGRIVFAGDSQLEPLYWAMVRKLDHDVEPRPPEGGKLTVATHSVELEYIRDPFLNSTGLLSHVEAQRTPGGPALLVLATGRDNNIHMNVEDFAIAIDGIAKVLHDSNQLRTNKRGEHLLLVAPVRETYHDLKDESSSAYTDMNAHLERQVDGIGSLVLWSFAEMTKGHRTKSNGDGWNLQWELSGQMADILLNLRCNAGAAKTRSFPNIRTCCGTWAGPNWVQTGFLVFAMVILPAVVVADYLQPLLRPKERTALQSASAFALAILLQYTADRTHIFEQVQRLPLHMLNLQSMLIATLLLGAVTIRRCSPPKAYATSNTHTNLPFLPRDQTDEMKGWMQLLIVIYHYNMAWTADRFWEIIRLTVASYLFLTGFGHTVYFLQKQDYSLRRVAAVLIRTNLLPCTLAFVMRTRWLLYYYMPLSTFWFLVVYATMAVGADLNKYKPILIGKILASATLVHKFIGTRDLPETVVRFFTITCKLSFNAGEFFHHRVKIDQYIVYVGMLVAIFYLWAKDALSSESTGTFLQRTFRHHFRWINAIAVALAIAGFSGFWYYVFSEIKSQSEWTTLQPYITFVPILTFLILRNAHPMLRNFHSAAFAWLGKYSGEMYVMQDHLFLAGDQEAVLRTGLFHGDDRLAGDRWRDLVLIIPLYLITCAVIGEATSAITSWFVAKADASAVKVDVGQGPDIPEVEMSLLSDEHKEEQTHMARTQRHTLQNFISKWTNSRPVLWPRTVKYRVIVVLAVMWALNMTYT